MPGIINFRDFGGQMTLSGQRVVKDRLYRCGHLADLEPLEFKPVLALDFAVIVDLRYAGERQRQCSPWPDHYAGRVVAHHGARNVNAPHLAILRSGALTPTGVDSFYSQLYRELPFDPLYQPLFAEAIRRIANDRGRALVHCTAGKDRTGILCALLLHCLGVPREAIIADYLRSSKAPGLLAMRPQIIDSARRRHGHELSEEAVDMLLDVRSSYLEGMFDTVEARHGAVDKYLERSGVEGKTVEKLRERLLNPNHIAVKSDDGAAAYLQPTTVSTSLR